MSETTEAPSQRGVLKDLLSEPPPQRGIVSRILRVLLFIFLLLIGLVILLLLIADFGVVMELAIHLVAGWFFYLREVSSQVTINAGLIASSLVVLGLAFLGLHLLAGSLWRRSQPEAGPWAFRWTAALTTMLLLLFASANAGAGIGHQLGWLKSMKWVQSNFEYMRARNEARQVLIPVREWAYDDGETYPPSLAEAFREVDEDGAKKLLLVRWPNDGMPEPWLYYGAALKWSSADDETRRILIASPRSSRGRRIVGYADGTSSYLEEEEFQTQLKQQGSAPK